jgi:hypothetical protein
MRDDDVIGIATHDEDWLLPAMTDSAIQSMNETERRVDDEWAVMKLRRILKESSK